jgi:hypothetical protein
VFTHYNCIYIWRVSQGGVVGIRICCVHMAYLTGTRAVHTHTHTHTHTGSYCTCQTWTPRRSYVPSPPSAGEYSQSKSKRTSAVFYCYVLVLIVPYIVIAAAQRGHLPRMSRDRQRYWRHTRACSCEIRHVYAVWILQGGVFIYIYIIPPCEIRHIYTECVLQAGVSIYTQSVSYREGCLYIYITPLPVRHAIHTQSVSYREGCLCLYAPALPCTIRHVIVLYTPCVF